MMGFDNLLGGKRRVYAFGLHVCGVGLGFSSVCCCSTPVTLTVFNDRAAFFVLLSVGNIFYVVKTMNVNSTSVFPLIFNGKSKIGTINGEYFRI